MEEENELLSRFRELSQRGRASVFTTIDALERLAPNLRKEFNKRFRSLIFPMKRPARAVLLFPVRTERKRPACYKQQ